MVAEGAICQKLGPARLFGQGRRRRNRGEPTLDSHGDPRGLAFDQAGTTVVHATNPLQRCLRDIFTGLKHGVLTPAILGRIGKVRLGLKYGQIRL